MNLGIAAFLVALVTNQAALEPLATPVMGAGRLLAILTFTLRLQVREAETAIPALA